MVKLFFKVGYWVLILSSSMVNVYPKVLKEIPREEQPSQQENLQDVPLAWIEPQDPIQPPAPHSNLHANRGDQNMGT